MRRYSRIDVTTSLTTEELGEIFKSQTRAMYGIGGKLGHGIRSMTSLGSDGFGYFSPTEDPFAARDDQPTAFAIGCTIPTMSYTNGGGVTLHMYVWDEGGHRHVELVAPHGMVNGASKSKKRLRRLVSAIQARDASATTATA